MLLSPAVSRDARLTIPQTEAAPLAAHAAAGRLLFFGALFFAAEILLAISSHGARRWQWLALALLCTLGLIFSVLIARQRESLSATGSLLLWFALLTRLPALFAAPLLDDDYFRFLWDGQQLLSGVSPYAAAPAVYFSQTLADPAWEAVLSGINHPDVPTIYGPSLQAVFALAALVGGADPLALKTLLVAADVALVALLLRSGAAPWIVLLYVINPLAIKEIGFSLHPDGVIALLLTLAALLLARQRWVSTAVFAAAVVCAKLPLLLLAAAFNLRRATHRLVLLAGALIALCAYLPFLLPDPAQPFVGLRAFADGWRYNALGFHLFEWLAGAQARLWLAVFYALSALAVNILVATGRLASTTAMVLLLTLILLTAPTVNPWYWLPLLPLAIVAFQHDKLLLVTPWIGSFALLLGYATELALTDLGFSSDVRSAGAEFSVLAPATVVQAAIMVAACGYDFFATLSARDRLTRHSTEPSTTSS